MNKIDRRSAQGVGLAAASAAMMKPAAAQDTGYKDTTPWPGVVAYDGTISHPGFKIVSCSTSSAAGIEDCRSPMMNPWSAISPKGSFGSSRKEDIAAKKNFVWTCDKGTHEQAFNDGTVVGTVRITNLKA